MLSSYPDSSVATDLELNVMADGFFHLATYTFTIIGLVLFSRAWRFHPVPKSGRIVLGAVIMGWGCSTSSRDSSITSYSGCTTSGPPDPARLSCGTQRSCSGARSSPSAAIS